MIEPVKTEALRGLCPPIWRPISRRVRGPNSADRIDIKTWIGENGLKVKTTTIGKTLPPGCLRSSTEPECWSGGRKWCLAECPFQPDDSGGNPFIEQLPQGILFSNASMEIAVTRTGLRFVNTSTIDLTLIRCPGALPQRGTNPLKHKSS